MPDPADQSETPSKFEGINYGRGIAAALGFGLIGFFAPIAVALAYTAFRWFLENAPAMDRNADVQRLIEQLVLIVIGGAFLFAAAGWATYAPRGKFKFASTLLIIFVLTVASWYLLRGLSILQPREKLEKHPLIYLSEFLILSLPPLVIALALTFYRQNQSKTLPNEPPSSSIHHA